MIIVAGVGVGLQAHFYEVEMGGDSKGIMNRRLAIIETVALSIFTLEVVAKVVAEGNFPWRYFHIGGVGGLRVFNVIDFGVVVMSYVALGFSPDQASLVAVVRLVRLVKLVDKVPELRIILGGLAKGMKSVYSIMMLLLL